MASKKKATGEGAVPALPFLHELLEGPLTLGQMLRAVREREEVSLETFAARLGISRGHLCDIEKGRRGVSPERAARWAGQLHLSEERLVAMALQAIVDEAGLKVRVDVTASPRSTGPRKRSAA